MTPSRHLIASSLLAAGCGVAYDSWIAGAAALVGGVAIDLDHLLDYLWDDSGPFTVKRFAETCSHYRLKRFYLLAHSLEWIIPALFLIWLLDAPSWLEAAGLGLAVHMLMDLIGNGIRVRAYFLSFRTFHRFNPRKFLYRLPANGLAYWGTFDDYLADRPRGRLAERRRHRG